MLLPELSLTVFSSVVLWGFVSLYYKYKQSKNEDKKRSEQNGILTQISN